MVRQPKKTEERQELDMYRIAICDDDRADRENILALIRPVMKENRIPYTVTQFPSAEAVMESREEKWDLLILDILMDGKNGIELAEELRSLGDQTDIIFITSSPEFALAGYRSWPVSYLLKPIEQGAFGAVMGRCLEKVKKDPPLIFHMKKGGQAEIGRDEIHYIEVFREELIVHSAAGSFSCTGSLKEACAQLPDREFYRCHRSYVVNLSYVNRMRRYDYILTDDTTVPVAKGNWQEAKQKWLDYNTGDGI